MINGSFYQWQSWILVYQLHVWTEGDAMQQIARPTIVSAITSSKEQIVKVDFDCFPIIKNCLCVSKATVVEQIVKVDFE